MENSSYHNDIIKGFDFNREDFKSPAKRNLMIGAEEADYVILADENVTSEEEIRQIITENDFLLDYGMVIFGENVPEGEKDFNNIIDYFKMNVYGVVIKKSILVYTGCYNEELTADIDYELAVRVAYYAEKLGVSYGKITLRQQKTRWGSCAANGKLNFNWLLILAPPEVLDYVVVHELCHRMEMNHSQAFWKEVEKILPDYRERQKWLKDNGWRLMEEGL